jgi:hypothetical protein
MRKVFALLICASAAVSAQAPVRDAGPASAAPRPAGGAGIAGVIRDQAEQPIRRALVTIASDGFTRSLVTDDEGRFTFTDLPAGRFTIQAAKPAYPSMSYGANRPYRPGPGLTLAEGQQASGVVLKLGRGAAISGAVFDELGKPMPGIPVMAWEIRTALSGERTLDFPANFGEAVTTDDRGMPESSDRAGESTRWALVTRHEWRRRTDRRRVSRGVSRVADQRRRPWPRPPVGSGGRQSSRRGELCARFYRI